LMKEKRRGISYGLLLFLLYVYNMFHHYFIFLNWFETGLSQDRGKKARL
jgi:hypothetical protein